MALGLIGQKRGMTRLFIESGESVPVTVVEVAPNRITRIKTTESDGYDAVQVTTDFHRVRDSMMDRLKVDFSDAQIVELTWRIALCGAFNRFNDVLQTEVDEGVDVLEQGAA